MKIKIKKLVDSAKIPEYQKQGDGGMDLTSTSMIVVDNKDFGYYEYGFGISLEIPENHVGLIFPRSSISNTGMILSNAVGVVDSGYRGEIKARFKYIRNSKAYTVGDRVAQLIVIPIPKVEFEEVQKLEDTDRAASAFGSTG